MSKNIIWILVIGFVLGFISREQWDTKSWEFIFLAMQRLWSILVSVVTGAIPIYIFYITIISKKIQIYTETKRNINDGEIFTIFLENKTLSLLY